MRAKPPKPIDKTPRHEIAPTPPIRMMTDLMVISLDGGLESHERPPPLGDHFRVTSGHGQVPS